MFKVDFATLIKEYLAYSNHSSIHLCYSTKKSYTSDSDNWKRLSGLSCYYFNKNSNLNLFVVVTQDLKSEVLGSVRPSGY